MEVAVVANMNAVDGLVNGKSGCDVASLDNPGRQTDVCPKGGHRQGHVKMGVPES
jgi:hypothetical protein